jgi:hypothetical protein
MLKLKGLISEVAEDPKIEKLIKDISKKTDMNDHTASILVLAKFLKDNKSVKILDAINDIHHIEQSMPYELGKYRSSILNGLLETLKNKYDANTYMKVSSAF